MESLKQWMAISPIALRRGREPHFTRKRDMLKGFNYPLGNPGQGERDSGMIPNGVPG
jgi:hypothetical protein